MIDACFPEMGSDKILTLFLYSLMALTFNQFFFFCYCVVKVLIVYKKVQYDQWTRLTIIQVKVAEGQGSRNRRSLVMDDYRLGLQHMEQGINQRGPYLP